MEASFYSYFCLEVTIFEKFESLDGKLETLYSWNESVYRKPKGENSGKLKIQESMHLR